jgi:hypothetical protein
MEPKTRRQAVPTPPPAPKARLHAVPTPPPALKARRQVVLTPPPAPKARRQAVPTPPPAPKARRQAVPTPPPATNWPYSHGLDVDQHQPLSEDEDVGDWDYSRQRDEPLSLPPAFSPPPSPELPDWDPQMHAWDGLPQAPFPFMLAYDGEPSPALSEDEPDEPRSQQQPPTASLPHYLCRPGSPEAPWAGSPAPSSDEDISFT